MWIRRGGAFMTSKRSVNACNLVVTVMVVVQGGRSGGRGTNSHSSMGSRLDPAVDLAGAA